MQKGSQPVPTSPTSDQLREVFGRASWANYTRNPVGMELIVSDVFLPCVIQPERLLYATVA